ncbi:hypothetical protein C2E21_2996 [Chlorella sorokiniana]|uniref:Uncharacterized protein n=1 Tax=Chlorella sorokiniana TaxID=3076 RepID=A0A2P6TXA8_CHLSO|nr:hypothetical protein C2E21_2996 [Chlorella sorokiniana]|eukprot:PRW58692.1 hypothetical protein C2E21_2996 [Chlorella sorokiniana]
MGQPAAAALLAPFPAPAAPGPCAEEAEQRSSHLRAVQACLQAEAARAAAELQAAEARTAAAREALAEGCTAAEQQHEGIAATLAGLAARLGCLAPGGAGAPPPLLSLDLPDSYARSCTQLLDLLAGYVQHHNDTSSAAGSASSGAASTAEQQQHRRRALELEQLQSGACKAARLRVEEEAEEARLLAELDVLRAHSSGPAAAASRGYSAADLEAEVASLQRRRDARLPKVAGAAEAAVAAAAGADVVEEQAAQRQAALERRLQAKQQAAALLARHLSRQLLIRQLLQHEQAVVQEVQLVAAAVRADAEAALQAALHRLPAYAQQQGSGAESATSSSGSALPEQAAAAAPGGEDPVAAVQSLLRCRQQLAQLLAQLQNDTLPAHQALFAKLHGMLYGGSGSDDSSNSGSSGSSNKASAGQAAGAAVQRPELTPTALREQLVAVTEAHSKLSLAANALVSEVLDRQQAPGAEQSRQLAQRVLTEFWSTGGPRRLVALAAEQRRKLESYV